MSISTIVNLFYYNKDRMREAGLDAENPPTTLEGWEEAGEALTDVSDSFQLFATKIFKRIKGGAQIEFYRA